MVIVGRNKMEDGQRKKWCDERRIEVELGPNGRPIRVKMYGKAADFKKQK